MRLWLYPIVVIAALLAVTSAQAQTYDPRYPVCMHIYAGPAGLNWYDCSFTSLPQCRATASGRAATCDLNPYYQFNAPSQRPRHKRSG